MIETDVGLYDRNGNFYRAIAMKENPTTGVFFFCAKIGDPFKWISAKAFVWSGT